MTQPDVLLVDDRIAVPSQTFADEAGGIVDFWGVVRPTEGGREISGIEYEAHRAMAEHQLRTIVDEARREFAAIDIVVQHRIGFVPAGEASLFVRVSSRHRAAAFRASSWMVDELKKRVPIWKKVRFLATETAAA